jgi:RNA polymerase sigma factor (sigma-70 family)
MDEKEWLAASFEVHRDHLRAVAYRMLGSLGEAEDATQEAWLRLSRSDPDAIENLEAWLTTVVARVCLNTLRTRRSRREEPLDADELRLAPAPRGDGVEPEQEALLADSVGLALLVVLDTLAPAERLAFVLHDMFDIPFDEIAHIVDRSPAAARQLASRARRRVRGATPAPDVELARQREVVDAFLAASRHGDFDTLVELLHADVVLRADGAARQDHRDTPVEVHGASSVARGAVAFAGRARFAQMAVVDGSVGIVFAPGGRLFVVLGFAIVDGRITAIDVIAEPERLRHLDLAVLDD